MYDVKTGKDRPPRDSPPPSDATRGKGDVVRTRGTRRRFTYLFTYGSNTVGSGSGRSHRVTGGGDLSASLSLSPLVVLRNDLSPSTATEGREQTRRDPDPHIQGRPVRGQLYSGITVDPEASGARSSTPYLSSLRPFRRVSSESPEGGLYA